MRERTAMVRAGRTGAQDVEKEAAAVFEGFYRANVGVVTAYFARRSADPQVVADLTADTFVSAISGFGSFEPGKGTARAWVFGIARHVYAAHCETYGRQQDRLVRMAGQRDLQPDETAELLDRIDSQRAGRELLAALEALPDRDRELIELVDIAGLRPREAAAVLATTPGAARMRLMRARGELRRRGVTSNDQTATDHNRGDAHDQV